MRVIGSKRYNIYVKWSIELKANKIHIQDSKSLQLWKFQNEHKKVNKTYKNS